MIWGIIYFALCALNVGHGVAHNNPLNWAAAAFSFGMGILSVIMEKK